jgi:hypothetical protein
MSDEAPTPSHAMIAVDCPMCGCVTNAALDASGDNSGPPEVGDFVICGGCATLCVYDACPDCGGLTMRLPTLEEGLLLARDQRKILEIKLAQYAVLQHRATHPMPDPDTH